MSQNHWQAIVEVTLKEGVLDPQGKAVHQGLNNLGFDSVTDVRMGKLIQLQFAAPSTQKAQELVEQMSQKLLANPIIEKFKIHLDEMKSK
jgi:phosphoribosylformylglycinamidine synthase